MADSHDTTVLPDRQLGGRVVPCPTRRALMGAVPASVAATVAAAATVYGQGPEPGTLASDDLERLAMWDAFNERFSIAAAMLKTDEMPWFPGKFQNEL